VVIGAIVTTIARTELPNFPPMVGSYRLGKLLGSGQLGRVWRAIDIISHACVVVKHLRKEVFDSLKVRFSNSSMHVSSSFPFR
jgi:serine/threonine protein kinase